MTETVGEFCYNKKDLIGHGAFAVVFKGHHRKKADFVVAVKVISKKNLSKTQSLLAKEIKILKELQHENVVALFDCQERPSSVFLVMEYCNGGDLADYLQDKGTLSEDTIRLFLQQIASAMHVLQFKGIVHRDLKPQNLLLSHSGRTHPSPSDIKVKIADFGFARFLPGEMMAATLCGSPMYMAPEVIMSKAYDARADLWSLGTIVYQCLTGKAPFQANSPQALKKFYEKNKSVCPNIPAGTSSHLKHLLMGLLRRNPKERIEYSEFFSHPFLTGGIPYRTSTPVAVPCRQRNHSGSSQGTRSSGSSSPSHSAEALGDIRVDLLRRMTPPYDVTGTSPQDPPTVIQVSGERSPNGGNGRTRRTSGTFMYSPPRQTLDEELEPEDFVMVPTSVEIQDGTPKTRYSWDPASPYGQSPPASSPFHGSPQTSPRRATFVIGSPSSPPTPRARTSSTGSRHSPTTHSPLLTPGQSPVTRRTRSSSSPGLPRPSTPPSAQTSTPIPVPRRATYAGLPVIANQPRRRNGSATPPSSLPKVKEQKHGFTPSPKGPTPVVTTTPPKTSERVLSPGRKQAPTGLVAAAATALTEQGTGIPPGGFPKQGQAAGDLSVQDPVARPTGAIQRALFTNIEQVVAGNQDSSPILSALARQANTEGAVVVAQPIARVHSSPAILATAAMGLPRNRAFLNTGAFHFAPSLRRNASTGSYAPFQQGLALGSSPPQVSPPLPTIPGSPTKSLQSRGESDQTMKPLKGLFTVGSSPPSATMISGDIIPFKSLPRNSQSGGSRLSPSGEKPVMVSPGSKITRGFSEDSPGSPRRSSFSQEVLPSSPEMEGTIALIAPELPEDTLMETEHTDGVRKLNFALSLVDAILDVIRAKAAPLTTLVDSMALRMNESLLSDQIGFISEECRTAEQLVLYLKALRVLSLTLQFAQGELKEHRLKPSNAVKNAVNDLTSRYRDCLKKTTQIKSSLKPRAHSSNEKTITANADKLMYVHAMDLCQNAALDELFGNPKECREKYETAQLLLQGLECDAEKDTDLALLERYKTSVETRLTQLSRRRTSSISSR